MNDCYIVTDDSLPRGIELPVVPGWIARWGPDGAAEIGEARRGSPTAMLRSALQDDGVSATTEGGIFDYATASEDY